MHSKHEFCRRASAAHLGDARPGPTFAGSDSRADQILPSLQKALDLAQPFIERDLNLRLPDNVTEQVDLTATILDRGASEPRALVLELQALSRLKRINKDDASVARQETTRRLIRGLAHGKNPLGVHRRGVQQMLGGSYWIPN